MHVALIPPNRYGNMSIMIQCWSKFNFLQCLIKHACQLFFQEKSMPVPQMSKSDPDSDGEKTCFWYL